MKEPIFLLFLAICMSVSPQFIKGSQTITWSKVTETYPLVVKYGDFPAVNGSRLTTAQVARPPTTIKWNADPAKFYLMALIDPDAPAKNVPVFGDVVHWLVGNIPGDKVELGDELASYLPPNPPLGGGIHRFVFLVYEQPYLRGLRGKLNYAEKLGQRTWNRLRFNIKDFANTYTLGSPIAQNYFIAGYFNG